MTAFSFSFCTKIIAQVCELNIIKVKVKNAALMQWRTNNVPEY